MHAGTGPWAPAALNRISGSENGGIDLVTRFISFLSTNIHFKFKSFLLQINPPTLLFFFIDPSLALKPSSRMEVILDQLLLSGFSIQLAAPISYEGSSRAYR